jgi:non-ribosomal peptide synthetase component F
VRFLLSAICVGLLWWGIGSTIVPDLFLRRFPASLVAAVIAGFFTAWLSRPFYRRSPIHLLWLTPVSVYFAATVFGYLLPLFTERVDVLARCLEMVRALCRGVTLTSFGLVVFPAAIATHWLLLRMTRADAGAAADARER